MSFFHGAVSFLFRFLLNVYAYKKFNFFKFVMLEK